MVKNRKLPSQIKILAKQSKNGKTVSDPVSHFPYPVFVRVHFYPVDSKTVTYNPGTGAVWDMIFPSRLIVLAF
jgi:hypothetical protein